MQITVRTYGLQNPASHKQGQPFPLEVPPGSAVADILRRLQIPESEVALVTVNERPSSLDRVLADGDVVKLFAPVGGGS